MSTRPTALRDMASASAASAAVRRFGDSRFGPGNWELAYAYGDHHSDRAVLSAAEHPRAVSPDRPLARTAREKGWEILDW